jgi:membrane-bound inhibitor of C-type lysozyme
MRALWLLPILALAGCNRPAADAPAPAPAAAPEVAAAAPGQPVNPTAEVIEYLCVDGQRVKAAYPDKATAVVDYKGHAYTLKAAVAASGVRYTGYGLQWWTKGLHTATLAPLKDGETVATAKGVRCDVEGPNPVTPPEPGAPGGLPDDRTPISEAPFTPTSAQGAADVVQTYYAHIGEGDYQQAWRLWSDAGRASNLSPAQFIGQFDNYRSYRALIGAPGAIEGAAGSLYVEVPVVIYGRRKSGAELHQSGKAVLRRINNVPGSTAEQRLWRISQIELKDTPR